MANIKIIYLLMKFSIYVEYNKNPISKDATIQSPTNKRNPDWQLANPPRQTILHIRIIPKKLIPVIPEIMSDIMQSRVYSIFITFYLIISEAYLHIT